MYTSEYDHCQIYWVTLTLFWTTRLKKIIQSLWHIISRYWFMSPDLNCSNQWFIPIILICTLSAKFDYRVINYLIVDVSFMDMYKCILDYMAQGLD